MFIVLPTGGLMQLQVDSVGLKGGTEMKYCVMLASNGKNLKLSGDFQR